MALTENSGSSDRPPPRLLAAKCYAKLGWKVFPIKPNGKTPAIKGWQQNASTESEQLQKWFSGVSAHNVGVLTGRPSGFFVVDVDPRNRGHLSLDALYDEIGKLPETVAQQTAGGGWHYLFRMPGGRDIRNGNIRGYPGIDIKGTGGYIVAPPSWVADRAYAWEESSHPEEVEIATAPEGLLRLIFEAPRPSLPEAPEEIQEGRRNSTLTSQAGKLRRMGWNFKEIREALIGFNQGRCKPPLPEQEVEGIALSVSRYDPGALTSAEPQLLRAYNRTDYGNAERLIAYYGEDLRYCPELDTWFVWNGVCWESDPGHRVMRRAMDTVRRIYGEAQECDAENDRRTHAKHALGSERVERLRAMVTLARNLPGVVISPGALDDDPYLINLINGTLDLRTAKVREHRREDLITRVAPVIFDPSAKCPVWQKFLIDITDGDEEMIRYLQRVLGLCLSGETTPRVLFLLHGTGHNGKTTLVETTRDVLGDYASSIPPEELMQIRRAERGRASPDLAKLPGKRFVTAMETEENQRLAAALVKAITGGKDAISVRDLYGKPFSFRPQFKLFVATNHRPRITDATSSIWGRVHLIPFVVQIPDPDRGEEPDAKGRVKDPKLDEKLRAELSGIFAWMVRGWGEYNARGLMPPPEVLEATRQYREQEDMVGQFLEDALIFGSQQEATVKELKACLEQWCERTGEKLGWRAVTERLRDLGGDNSGKVRGERGWRGLAPRRG